MFLKDEKVWEKKPNFRPIFAKIRYRKPVFNNPFLKNSYRLTGVLRVAKICPSALRNGSDNPLRRTPSRGVNLKTIWQIYYNLKLKPSTANTERQLEADAVAIVRAGERRGRRRRRDASGTGSEKSQRSSSIRVVEPRRLEPYAYKKVPLPFFGHFLPFLGNFLPFLSICSIFHHYTGWFSKKHPT